MAGLDDVQRPHYAYNHSELRGGLQQNCHRRLIRHRRGVLPGRRLPGAVQRRAVLRRPHPQRIWAMLPAPTGCPIATGGRFSSASTPTAPLKSRRPEDRPRRRPVLRRPGGGTVRRISYAANQPPTAVITASPTTGPAPLTVSFNGSGSSDPDRQTAELRVGPQRRRHVRRRDRLDRLVHLHRRGRVSPRACGSPTTGRQRHNIGHHQRGQHRPDGDHRHAPARP